MTGPFFQLLCLQTQRQEGTLLCAVTDSLKVALDFAMGAEGDYAIVTDEEEIKRLFPTPLLAFGELELTRPGKNTTGKNTSRSNLKGKKSASGDSLPGEGGVRSRVPALSKSLPGNALLPDSLEYISNLEKMANQSRAKQFSMTMKGHSEVEMSTVGSAASVLCVEDDENIPFIDKVMAESQHSLRLGLTFCCW